MALDHFRQALRDLAPTQALIADHLDVSAKTIERFLDADVPLAVRTLLRAPQLLLALAQDAAEGNIPAGTTREQRKFQKRPARQDNKPVKPRRTPKQSTVRL